MTKLPSPLQPLADNELAPLADTHPATDAMPLRIRAPHDTSSGCRERSAADLLESVTMTTANGRLRLESSAASWTVRADMLHRLEQKAEQRAKAPAPAEEIDPWL